MNSPSCLIISCAVLGTFASFGFAADKEDYLAESADRPRLRDRLVVREEQLGFAGVSGRTWVVEPDGHWRVAEIQPAGSGKVQEKTLASGELTPDEVVALADVLAHQDFTGLPHKVGKAEKANPHRIILRFGDKQTVVDGIIPRRSNKSTGEIISDSAPKENAAVDKIWSRCAAVAHAVESRASKPKP